jgi:hypothetical protein
VHVAVASVPQQNQHIQQALTVQHLYKPVLTCKRLPRDQATMAGDCSVAAVISLPSQRQDMVVVCPGNRAGSPVIPATLHISRHDPHHTNTVAPQLQASSTQLRANWANTREMHIFVKPMQCMRTICTCSRRNTASIYTSPPDLPPNDFTVWLVCPTGHKL